MLDRVVALLFVIAAAIVPIKMLDMLDSQIVQFICACIVVLWMVFMDVYAGLLLGAALMMAYFRLHSQHILGWGWGGLGDLRKAGPMANLVQDYITPEHLHSAQSNVVDITDYDTEMKGIKGVYGEAVYGAQGMDATMPGFIKETSLMGDVFTRG